MKQDRDRQHLEKVLAGDKEAFRYFIDCYQQMALRIALSLVRDEHQARQVVQSAFIQAYKGLAAFRREAQFSTWLYRIVVNESIKANRLSNSARLTVPISADHSISLRVNNGALEALEFQERKNQIKLALEQMKPKERLILELFYLQEKSVAEIEAITGFSSSNVKVLLHRARKNFATFFKPAK